MAGRQYRRGRCRQVGPGCSESSSWTVTWSWALVVGEVTVHAYRSGKRNGTAETAEPSRMPAVQVRGYAGRGTRTLYTACSRGACGWYPLVSHSPHSSGERATASGAVSAGSNPAGGAPHIQPLSPLACENAERLRDRLRHRVPGSAARCQYPRPIRVHDDHRLPLSSRWSVPSMRLIHTSSSPVMHRA